MTFAEMNNMTFRLMRDTNESKYSTTYVDLWLNEAERIYCSKTGWSVKKDVSITAASGIQEYSLPTDFGREEAVYYNGTRIHKCFIEDTISETASSGTPGLYYIRQKKIGLESIPDATGTVTLIYYGIGGAMDSNNDSIIPIEHQMTLTFYACYMCALEGHDNRVNEFLNNFLSGIEEGIIDNTDKAFAGGWPVVGEDREALHSLDHATDLPFN